MSIKLSICIPTYNRSMALDEALLSISNQINLFNDEVEVIISDNSSTDNTSEIVNKYKHKINNIIYNINELNIGADKNFLKAVSLASGEFCMILGSDDALAPNFLRKILSLIGEYDIYLMDRVNMTQDMRLIVNPCEKFMKISSCSVYKFSSLNDYKKYYNDCIHIGSLFSYISTIIFRGSMWKNTPTHESLLGSYWAHVSKLNEMQKAGATLKYIGEPLILNRTNNDSFLVSLGYSTRRVVDLNFVNIPKLVFGGNSYQAKSICKITSKQYLTFRCMFSDKRSSLLSDGSNCYNLIEAAYKEHYSITLILKIKIYIVRKAPLSIWNLLHPSIKKFNKIIST